MDQEQELLVVAMAYGEAMKLSLARVATQITGGGIFFKRLEEGGGCTTRSYRKTMQWFSERWPEGLDWPAEVKRPDPVPKASEDAA